MEHTKAEPWQRDGLTIFALCNFPARHGIVTTGNLFSAHVSNDNNVATADELEAIARNILAAPDLLTALEKAHCWIPDGTRRTPEQRGAKCETATEVDEMIRAAIAKARLA